MVFASSVVRHLPSMVTKYCETNYRNKYTATGYAVFQSAGRGSK
jgi:hypothetical protein